MNCKHNSATHVKALSRNMDLCKCTYCQGLLVYFTSIEGPVIKIPFREIEKIVIGNGKTGGLVKNKIKELEHKIETIKTEGLYVEEYSLKKEDLKRLEGELAQMKGLIDKK